MRTHFIRSISIVTLLVLLQLSSLLAGTQAQQRFTEPQETIPTIESEHPYKNNANTFWTIPNNSGQSAARIHFSRIELEKNVDKIEIRDANDTLIQEITTSAPDGLWTDTVPGASIKVVLKSDGSGQFWGLSIDQLEAQSYTTLGYSPHPYPNNSTDVKTLVNSTPNPAGTRVRFDRIDLEDGVDYLVIKDLNDTPYQWITGNHPSGLTSKAVPGSGIKVQLVTDSSGRAWGYNITEVQSAAAEAPDTAPLRTALAESDHPYPYEFSKVWILTNPDPNALSSKIHFSRLQIGSDHLQILDANDTVIQTFGGYTKLTDVWSDYVPGRIVKIKLVDINCCGEDWGFRVDNIVNSISTPGLAQSNHPYQYPNEFSKIWTLTNPDPNSLSSKIHFSRLQIGSDHLQILDANDTVIQTFGGGTKLTDVWSDYVPGRIVKIKLVDINCCGEDWGFRVDNIVNSISTPGLAQSNHPYQYPNEFSKIWTLTNPNVNAQSSKVHFNRLQIGSDHLQILDANDTVIQTFGGGTKLTDVWSDYVPGRIIKIKLVDINCCGEDWGFRVDAIEPSSTQAPPRAGVNAVLIQINAAADVYVNGVKQFHVSVPGEYRISFPAAANVTAKQLQMATFDAATPGSYEIKIDYMTGDSQVIQATIGADGGMKIMYMPLVKR